MVPCAQVIKKFIKSEILSLNFCIKCHFGALFVALRSILTGFLDWNAVCP